MTGRRRGPGLRDVLWGLGLLAGFLYVYCDHSAPSHQFTVYAVHVYSHRPLDVLWGIIGGLGFWFGMRARWGR